MKLNEVVFLKNSFIKKISIYFLGTLSSNLINVLLLPLYAYYINAEDLGTYDYYVTISSVITPVAYFSIWEAFLRFAMKSKCGDNDYKEYKKTIIVFFELISLFLFITTICIYLFMRKNYVIWVGIIAIVHGGTFVWQFASRAEADNKGYAISGMMGSLSYVALVFIFVLLNLINYTTLIISHIISQLLIVLVIEIRIRLLGFSNASFSTKKIIHMLRFSLPLVMNNISLWVYSGVNKFLINKYIGAKENGLYSFSNKFSLLISLASTIISLAFIEEAYGYEDLEQ